MNKNILKVVPLMFCFGTLIGCNNNPPAPDPKAPEVVSISIGSTPLCYAKDVALLKDDIVVRASLNDGTSIRVYDWTTEKDFFDENGRHTFKDTTSKDLTINYQGKQCTLSINKIKDEFDGQVTEIQWKRIFSELLYSTYKLEITNDATISSYFETNEEETVHKVQIASSQGTTIYEQYYENYYWQIDKDGLITFNGNDIRNTEIASYLQPINSYFFYRYDDYSFDDKNNKYLIDIKGFENFNVSFKATKNNIVVDTLNYIDYKEANDFIVKTYNFDFETEVDPSKWKIVDYNVFKAKFSKSDIDTTNTFERKEKADKKQYFFLLYGNQEKQEAFTQNLLNTITLSRNDKIEEGLFDDSFHIYKNGSIKELAKGEDGSYIRPKDEKEKELDYLSFIDDSYTSKDNLVISYTNSTSSEDTLTFNFSYNIPSK